MEKVLLYIIAASALCGVSLLIEHQQRFVYEPKTWSEARSYCTEKYIDMVTVTSMEDVNVLNDLVDLSRLDDPSSTSRAWIGLISDDHTWTWSDSNFNNGVMNFSNWMNGQPDNSDGHEDCVSMFDSGEWNDANCGAYIKPVCYQRGSNVTFIYINDHMPWTEAQSYCRQHHTDLASIGNWSDIEDVKALIPPGTCVWIGLLKSYSADSWKLPNGSRSTFNHWKKGEPNDVDERCVAADFANDGKWEDWTCDSKMAFVCFYEIPLLKQVMRVKLVRSSSLDLRDPAVQDEMLKQIEQKLKDQGVSKDIKLSWRRQADGEVFHKVEEETTKGQDEL
ncbi:macrophage mannose receptor 1-like [Leuresthes tenuis]|uniref:macrophage mannose receptor 1-like n=1 Tax=Leuresthes tenuis TaxID=355514 RepID=UPI003B50C1CA